MGKGVKVAVLGVRTLVQHFHFKSPFVEYYLVLFVHWIMFVAIFWYNGIMFKWIYLKCWTLYFSRRGSYKISFLCLFIHLIGGISQKLTTRAIFWLKIDIGKGGHTRLWITVDFFENYRNTVIKLLYKYRHRSIFY